MKTTILIATKNAGKAEEIQAFFKSLPFVEWKTLADVDPSIEAPEETASTLLGNAMIKAQYYAEKTGLPALADDTGLFIDALDGWPGVQTARVADTDDERRNTVLEKLDGQDNRSAAFHCAIALYDPRTDNQFTTVGTTKGMIATEQSTGEHGFGYDPIFEVTDTGKTYADMSISEKSDTSHRGKALQKLKYYLQNTYGAKHIVVPFSIVVKDGKVLMILRNDPHRPEYHRKWEFPGGTLEFGEQMEENVIRETKEETGYIVEPLRLLQYIKAESQEAPTFQYQVVLIPYVCKIVGGEANPEDRETLDMQWFDIDEVLNHDLVGENDRVFSHIKQELTDYINEHSL